MANNYNEILALVNAGNQMGLSNTIKRDYGIPLDFTSVQASLDDAVKYAATSTLAYVGQPIAVGGKLYIITDTAAKEKYVAADSTQYDNYLAEVGSATEGDGTSISLENGVLSISGFKAAAGATLPQKQADGSIKWVGIDAIVEGDGNTKSVVAVAEGSAITVTPSYDEDNDTYTYTLDVTLPDVYTKAEVDEKFVAKSDYTPYDDAELRASIQTKADADSVYDKTAADEKFFAKADLETTLAPYAKSADVNEQLDAINASIAGITHFETKVVTSTEEVVATGVLYLIKDESVTGSDKYNEYLFIEGQGAVLIGDTTTDLSDYVTTDALASAIESFVTTENLETELAKKVDVETYTADKATFATTQDVAETYATKQDLVDHSNTMTTTLSDYAKTADVNSELAKKVDSAEVSHTTETIAEGATIVDGKLSIVVDAYTKAETLEKIEEKITEINGGESAGEVLSALNSYKETNDARVGAIETKNNEQDVAIAAAQAQADKGVADARTANDSIVTINETLTTQEEDIAAVKGRLTTLETAKGNHETRIATAEGKITGIESSNISINSKLGEIEGSVEALSNEDARLAGLVDTKANASDVYTKSDVDSKISEINNVVDTKANSADVYTKDEVDAALANLDQTDIENAIKANTDAISTLVGQDTNKSVRAIAAEEINTLVDAANSEDTITNINSLVTYVNDNAGDIAQLTASVESNTNKLAGIDTTVLAAINNAVAGVLQPKESDEISVGADGTLGIKSLNVNKLVQTEGDVIVLNGGNSTT